jgi:hypothetical protein
MQGRSADFDGFLSFSVCYPVIWTWREGRLAYSIFGAAFAVRKTAFLLFFSFSFYPFSFFISFVFLIFYPLV